MLSLLKQPGAQIPGEVKTVKTLFQGEGMDGSLLCFFFFFLLGQLGIFAKQMSLL